FLFFMKELNVLITTTGFNMNYWKGSLEAKRYQLDYKIIENTAGKLFETYDKKKKLKDTDKLIVGFAGRYADWKNWPLTEEIIELLYKKIGSKLEIQMAVGCLDQKS